MNENEYLQQVATLTGLQYFPGAGPWGRKSGCAIGLRDGYLTTVGFSRSQREAQVVILVRFSEVAQPDLLKAALAENPSIPKKQGKLGGFGKDFLRWEWKYSFTKPKAEDVAKLADALRESLKPLAQGFDGRCEFCKSGSTSGITMMNKVPGYICSRCQERQRQEMDQAAINYEKIEPNHANGLALGVLAATAGGVAWGLVAYAIHRIFLYGAILIGYLVAAAVIKGTRKVTTFGQVLVPILTVASGLFGDAIFFTLVVMKSEKVSFSLKLLQAVLANLWDIEMKGNGVLTLVFALVGAGYALYAARKPKFKTSFEPLGAPAPR
jgi:hypothetical protein